MRAIVLVTADAGKSGDVLNGIRRISTQRGRAIGQAGLVFGRWDIIGELEVANSVELANYVTQLHSIGGTRSTETLIGFDARPWVRRQPPPPSACILVRVFAGKLNDALTAIRGPPVGVGDDNAYPVFGRYDIVVFKHGSLADITSTATAINSLNPRVKSTETAVAPLDWPEPM